MPWTSNVRTGGKSKASPAIAEFSGLLHMVHIGDESNDLWHATFDGTSWSQEVRIPDQRSKAAPALAVFGNRLHMVHLGNSSNDIWHSSFDGTRWTTNVRIPNQQSKAPPALAAFDGRLHMVHLGNSSNDIWHSSFDDIQWTPNVRIEGQKSKAAVALCALVDRLHMVHLGDTSNDIWHSMFDGANWTTNIRIPDQRSKASPALAAFDDRVHMVHLGDSSNRIWYAQFDGAWTNNVRIPYQLSKAAPALASFGTRLDMVHLGDSSNDIWESSSDGVLSAAPNRRVIIINLDGLRWDVLYKHLVTVRDAGATTEQTYRFSLPPGASRDTVLGNGGQSLRSALGELCFGDGMGMVDVRMARASYPTFTLSSHATMYSGVWPNRHGIAAHKFIVRDGIPEWDTHAWDSLPRAPALQGFCTDATSGTGAFLDSLWGGLDQVGPTNCVNRNRGIVSDLRVANLYDIAGQRGFRSTVIHNFYHGALRPWEAEGRDFWWRTTPGELRSLIDACSEEDLDQDEVFDGSGLNKARLLLRFQPSSVKLPSSPTFVTRFDQLADRVSGEFRPVFHVTGEPHPDGPPDIITIYLSSIDRSSHKDGIANQGAYLAWFDHRLALFVRDLRSLSPEVFANTVFALVSDHGHLNIANDPDHGEVTKDNELTVREELVRIALGDEEGNDVLAQLAQAASTQPAAVAAIYKKLVTDATSDRFGAWEEAMNFLVFIRAGGPEPLDVARRLLALTLRIDPVGAFVRVRGRFMFLQRGNQSPVEVDSPECRLAMTPHLDLPTINDAELDATSLSPEARAAERDLRFRMLNGEAFDLLRIPDRVAGLSATGEINRSADVILIAPSQRSFSATKSTHGSVAYPTTRIPMLFFGPGIRRRETIAEADQIDFTPTILSLLGTDTSSLDVDGSALVDYSGQPLRRRPRVRPPRPRIRTRPGPYTPALLTDRPVLHVKGTSIVDSSFVDEHPEYPCAVALSIRLGAARRPALLEGEMYLQEYGSAAGEAGHGSASVRIPEAMLIQEVTVELPRLPPWLERIIGGGAEALAPYVFPIPEAILERCARAREALGACAAVQPFPAPLLLQMTAAYSLLSGVVTRIDGAAIARVHDGFFQALDAPPPVTRTARSTWDEAVPRMRSAWNRIETTGGAHPFSPGAYDDAVFALARLADSVPHPLDEAAREAATQLRGRYGRLPDVHGDAQRRRVARDALRGLLGAREVLVLHDMPGSACSGKTMR